MAYTVRFWEPTRIGQSGRAAPRIALTAAGGALLAMAVLAGLANGLILQPLLTTPGGAGPTPAAELALAAWTMAVVAVLDVVVAVALYRVFVGVDRFGAALMSGLRIGYAAWFAVAIGHLFRAASLASDGPATAFGVELATFDRIWSVGLSVFGLHLLALAWVSLRSGFVPKWIAAAVALCGLGYLIDGVAAGLALGLPVEVGVFTFWGEVVFLAWLLRTGWRSRTNPRVPTEPAPRPPGRAA